MEIIFSGKPNSALKEKNELIEELYKQVGQLKVELDWLKKKLPEAPSERLKLIDKDYSILPITKQCELLNLNRSNVYYRPVAVSDYDLLLMNKIDELYTEMPFYGSPKITKHLQLVEGLTVNHKKIERLMRKMGISAIRPQRNTRSEEHTSELQSH